MILNKDDQESHVGVALVAPLLGTPRGDLLGETNSLGLFNALSLGIETLSFAVHVAKRT